MKKNFQKSNQKQKFTIMKIDNVKIDADKQTSSINRNCVNVLKIYSLTYNTTINRHILLKINT